MDINEEKQQLQERQQELIERLEAIEQDYRSGLEADAEERAVQLENAEVLENIGQAAADELAEIEKRLEELG